MTNFMDHLVIPGAWDAGVILVSQGISVLTLNDTTR